MWVQAWRVYTEFIEMSNVRYLASQPQEPFMPQSLNDQLSRQQQIEALEKDWAQNPRWKGIKRNYTAADVVRLRGSLHIEHTLADRKSTRLNSSHTDISRMPSSA